MGLGEVGQGDAHHRTITPPATMVLSLKWSSSMQTLSEKDVYCEHTVKNGADIRGPGSLHGAGADLRALRYPCI